ncbi:hypothetical protein MVI27_10015 [Chryseobacterium salipaludis]|uniref:hypothetical protein n=1 Tax=Chryseobacterium TaxID=59732 RepID=UPI001FF2DF70|nr:MULTISPECIES: hypothetical protein [Chryseobacterium]MCJ8498594.1 hypothetical protein [Chryseobacterium salipaludis]MCX3297756.1 hypothetical protein [Planobacterium sp. JC490]
MARAEYINEVAAESSLLSRYDIIITILSVLLAYNIAVDKTYLRNNNALIFFYFIFLLLTLLMGTRLNLVNYLLGFFGTFFILNKNFLLKNRGKLTVAASAIILFLTIYQTVRGDIANYFATDSFSISRENITLVPTEFFTGILSESHLSVIPDINNEHSYFTRLLPKSIKNFLQLENYDTYAVEIASKSRFSSGNVVYTVPYATDVFHGSADDLFLFLITSTIIYITFSYIAHAFSKTNLMCLVLLYFIIYNVFRAEGPIWFSKFYLNYFLLYLITLLIGKRNVITTNS